MCLCVCHKCIRYIKTPLYTAQKGLRKRDEKSSKEELPPSSNPTIGYLFLFSDEILALTSNLPKIFHSSRRNTTNQKRISMIWSYTYNLSMICFRNIKQFQEIINFKLFWMYNLPLFLLCQPHIWRLVLLNPYTWFLIPCFSLPSGKLAFQYQLWVCWKYH